MIQRPSQFRAAIPNRPGAVPPSDPRRRSVRLSDGDCAALDDAEPRSSGRQRDDARIKPDGSNRHTLGPQRAFRSTVYSHFGDVAYCAVRFSVPGAVCCPSRMNPGAARSFLDLPPPRRLGARCPDRVEEASSQRDRGAPDPGGLIAGLPLPGLPNLHCHAFQRGMAGLAEVRGPSADSSGHGGRSCIASPCDSPRKTGGHRGRLCGDAGGGIHDGGRVSLSPPRSRWQALREYRGNGGTNRSGERSGGDPPDTDARVLRPRQLRR